MFKNLFLLVLILCANANFVCQAAHEDNPWNQEIERLKSILNVSDAELNYIAKINMFEQNGYKQLSPENQKLIFWHLPILKRAQILSNQRFNKPIWDLNDSTAQILRLEALSLWGIDEDNRGDNSKEQTSKDLNQSIRKNFIKLISDFDENSVILFAIGCYIGIFNRSATEISTWPKDAIKQQLPKYFTSAANSYKKNKFKVFLIDPSFGKEFDIDMPLSLRASGRKWKEQEKKTDFVRWYNNENIDVYVIPMYVNLDTDVNLILNAAEKVISKNGVALIINFAFPTLDTSFKRHIKLRKLDIHNFFYWYYFDDMHPNKYPKVNLLSFNDKEIVIGSENDMVKSKLMLLKKDLLDLKLKLNKLQNKLSVLQNHLIQKIK